MTGPSPELAERPLSGRVALVTGAGRGLGHAIAAALAGAGAQVVLSARSHHEIEAAAAALTAAGAQAIAIPCDVRDAAQVDRLVHASVEHFGGLDVLVQNAGIFRMAPIAAMDDGMWKDVLETNLTGAFLVTRAALPALIERRGRVFTMVSSAGRTAFRNNAAYGASKWGLLGFTNVLREELRGAGVRVTAVLPGPVDTSIWNDVPGSWDRTRMLQPETVARMIVEVCSQPEGTSTDEIVLSPAGGSL